MRIGMGYDVHRLTENRKLILLVLITAYCLHLNILDPYQENVFQYLQELLLLIALLDQEKEYRLRLFVC